MLFLSWCRLPWQPLDARPRNGDTFACRSRETKAFICCRVCVVPAENEPAEEIKKKTQIRAAVCGWEKRRASQSMRDTAPLRRRRTAEKHRNTTKRKQRRKKSL